METLRRSTPCKYFRRILACGIGILLLVPGVGCDDAAVGNSDVDAGDPRLVFRLALELKPETIIWEASHLFQEELAKASPEHDIAAGEIQVQFYDRGMIGTERQLLEACYFGVVEVVQINTSVVTTVEPYYAVLDLPYLFVDEAHHERVLNGPTGDELLAKLKDHGFEGLGFYCAGFRNLFYKTADDEPCADSPADLAGLKIRVMESPVMIGSINAMGPTATPIPFSELYQSLRTGVVDGAENSGKVFVSSKYHETGCNCFTLTEHFTNQHVLVASGEWFDDLEPKYQQRLREVARQIVPKFNERWDSESALAQVEMAEHGVTVNRVRDKTEFFHRVGNIADQFFNDYPQVPRELYERILAAGNLADPEPGSEQP
jgi:TRAP-type transport system periplasmic protein